jgi:hypothetical protein
MLQANWERLHLSARLTLLLLVALFAVNIYRAATQGITVDEAFTYQHFVAPSFAQVMTSYDVNHHVLNSLLAKFTASLFGTSELTLRMPSLLGGLIYLIAVRAIVLQVFSPGWALAAFGLLSLNPFTLDYLSAARGYGLALGLLFSALWFLLQRKWYGAGICFGLAAGANLSFLYPIGGLLAAAALVDASKKTVGVFLERVLVPFVVLPFVLYVLPLSQANPEQFAFSPPTLLSSLWYLVTYTFARNQVHLTKWVLQGCEMLVLLVLAAGALGWVVIRRNKPSLRLMSQCMLLDRLILLNAGGMLLCLAITWLAHVTVGAGYPYSRTGVYWPVMLTLGGAALVERFVRWPILRWTAWSLAALCLAGFVYEFETGYYEEWRFDAASKRIANLILEKGGRGPVRIACSGILQHSLRFYANLNHANWQIIEDPHADGEFHVLLHQDYRPELKLLYQDPVSGAVIMQ